jgi:hypothetical protein
VALCRLSALWVYDQCSSLARGYVVVFTYRYSIALIQIFARLANNELARKSHAVSFISVCTSYKTVEGTSLNFVTETFITILWIRSHLGGTQTTIRTHVLHRGATNSTNTCVLVSILGAAKFSA